MDRVREEGRKKGTKERPDERAKVGKVEDKRLSDEQK
jgi:hypothetical protein